MGRKNGKDKKGSSCHQCKSRRNKNMLIWCSSNEKSKPCKKKYCDNCLKKFYLFTVYDLSDKERNEWICPSCKLTCSCAACRRKEEQKRKIEINETKNSQRTSNNNSSISNYQSKSNENLSEPKNSIKIDIKNEKNSNGTFYDNEIEEKNEFCEYDDPFNLLFETAQNPGNKLKMIQVLANKEIDENSKIKAISAILQEGIY